MVGRIKRIFSHENSTLLSAAAILAVSSLLSRLVGLLRDRLLASTLGAGDALDIYYGAFRLPDFVFNILIGGAVSAAFIPIFAEIFSKNKEEGWRYGTNIINFTFLSAVAICVLLILFAEPIVRLIVPGFGPEKLALTVKLTRIMFLSPIFLGLSSLFSGLLQYFNRFFVYSLAPILYNIGIIIGIVFLYPALGLVGLAWGVALGALMHLAIQIPAAVSAGWQWNPFLRLADKKLWETLFIMAPRTFSLLSLQINLWAITAISSLLTAGSVAIFYLADNLQHLPVGVFGFSLAIALFPALSRAEAVQNKEEFFKHFSEGLRLIFFFTFPLSVLFFVLRAHIVRVVLGAGNFGWVDTRLTAAVLGIFSFSIFLQSIQPLLNRAFFSLKDSKIPTLLTVVFVCFNVALALVFINSITPDSFISKIMKVDDLADTRVLGLPLAFTIASFLQIGLLMILLKRKINFDTREIWISILKVFAGAIIAVPVCYIALYGLAQFLPTDTFVGVFLQGLIAGIVSLAIFLLAVILLRSPEVKILNNFLERKFKIKIPQIWPEKSDAL